MLETLNQFDRSWFIFVQEHFRNEIFDISLHWFGEKKVWVPLYVLLLGHLLFVHRFKGLRIAIIIGIMIGVADLAGNKLKYSFERPRPCDVSEIKLALNDITMNKTNFVSECPGKSFSMPSNHAINHFALGCFFFFYFWKRKKWLAFIFIAWAVIISYSRIYVGLHYPFDILVGGLIGIISGTLFFAFVHRYVLKKE